MNIASIIHEELRNVAQDTGLALVSGLNDNTPVFESGLDSLGFAILVAKLEERLGFDPFAAMATPVYPTTIGEFIQVYEAHGTR